MSRDWNVPDRIHPPAQETEAQRAERAEQLRVGSEANSLFGSFWLGPKMIDGEEVWVLRTRHYAGVGRTPDEALKDCIEQARAARRPR